MRVDEYYLDDADIVVVAFGCTARSAQRISAGQAGRDPRWAFSASYSLAFPEERVKEFATDVGTLSWPR